MRVLFMFYVENTKAASIAISAFLGGLAVSSLLFSKLGHGKDKKTVFRYIFVMQFLSAIYGYFILKHYEIIPYTIDYVLVNFSEPILQETVRLILVWGYLFIPAFFFGGVFPLVNGLYLSAKENAIHDTGIVYFWDTVGAILGALIAGFVLLPYFGLSVTIMIAVLGNILLCALLPTFRLVLIFIPAILAYEHFFVSPLSLYGTQDSEHLSIAQQEGDAIIAAAKAADPVSYDFGELKFAEQSPFGRISVYEKDNTNAILINYRDMCFEPVSPDNGGQSMVSEILLADIPLERVPDGADVLNIGLGCGGTAKAALRSPKLKNLDIAEINPIIVKANKKFFRSEDADIYTDPRVNLYVRDGAEHLRITNKKYDSIIIDIEEVSVLHSAPFFTKEYFEIIKNKMKPGGIFGLWSFNVTDHPEFAKIMYNTGKAVFPHVRIRLVDQAFLLLFASTEPIKMTDVSFEERKLISKILKTDMDLVNTIDKPVVEQYYDINALFALPKDYRDPHARYAEEDKP